MAELMDSLVGSLRMYSGVPCSYHESQSYAEFYSRVLHLGQIEGASFAIPSRDRARIDNTAWDFPGRFAAA